MFTTITTMALLQRFLLMMMIICCFVLLYYVSNKIRFKNILLFSSIVIVAFFFVSLMRSNGAITLYGYIMSRMDFPVRYALFTDPYMYVAMNVENFAHAAEVHSEYSFGFYTFDSVFAVTGLKHWMTDYFMTDATPYLITGTYNTYTAFWTFYRDFGLYGLFLIPFIAGCAVQYVYSALYRSPSIMRLVLYCLSIFLIALSFFVNYTGFLWFDIDVLMGIIVSHVATVRSRDIKLARS
jgi:oligosaccharide repeat unit polymerase